MLPSAQEQQRRVTYSVAYAAQPLCAARTAGLRQALSAPEALDLCIPLHAGVEGTHSAVVHCEQHVPVERIAPELLMGDTDPTQLRVNVHIVQQVEHPPEVNIASMPPHRSIQAVLARYMLPLPPALAERVLSLGVPDLDLTRGVTALVLEAHTRTVSTDLAYHRPSATCRLKWALGVAEAVAHMWQHGWLHLRLTLQHLLLANDDRVVVAGLDRAVSRDIRTWAATLAADMRLCPAPEVQGLRTVPEGSAEAVAAAAEVDLGRLQVWTLGAVLRQLLPVEFVAEQLPAELNALLDRLTSELARERPADPCRAYWALWECVQLAAPDSATFDAVTHQLPFLADLNRVTLDRVTWAYSHSKTHLHLHRDGATVATPWPLLHLQAWGEVLTGPVAAAARMCLALLLFDGSAGEARDEVRAQALALGSLEQCLFDTEQEQATALWLLGECFARGLAVPADPAEAVRRWRRAMLQGHVEARYSWARCKLRGLGGVADPGAAVEELVVAAEAGHAGAALLLAECYTDGTGTGRDAREAMAWMRRAAEGGLAEAQYQLARAHYTHALAEQGVDTALTWGLSAAEQGHAGAQALVANLYGDRGCVDQARKWHHCAARQGDVESQLKLGRLLRADAPYEAEHWLRLAADKGMSAAQEELRALASRNQSP